MKAETTILLILSITFVLVLIFGPIIGLIFQSDITMVHLSVGDNIETVHSVIERK